MKVSDRAEAGGSFKSALKERRRAGILRTDASAVDNRQVLELSPCELIKIKPGTSSEHLSAELRR